MTKTWVIDPPSGWKYGFPKAVPAGVMKNDSLLRLWLTGEGHTYEVDWDARKAYQARITNGFRLFGKYYEGLWN